jgi:hypothetical protein
MRNPETIYVLYRGTRVGSYRLPCLRGNCIRGPAITPFAYGMRNPETIYVLYRGTRVVSGRLPCLRGNCIRGPGIKPFAYGPVRPTLAIHSAVRRFRNPFPVICDSCSSGFLLASWMEPTKHKTQNTKHLFHLKERAIWLPKFLYFLGFGFWPTFHFYNT